MGGGDQAAGQEAPGVGGWDYNQGTPGDLSGLSLDPFQPSAAQYPDSAPQSPMPGLDDDDVRFSPQSPWPSDQEAPAGTGESASAPSWAAAETIIPRIGLHFSLGTTTSYREWTPGWTGSKLHRGVPLLSV